MNNIIMYGVPERLAREAAERYGLALCDEFDDMAGDAVLLQRQLLSEDEQLAFFERMTDRADEIDAVIVLQAVPWGIVQCCSPQHKFFTLDGGGGDEALAWELHRIVESHLGLICAHEGVEAVKARRACCASEDEGA